MRVPSFTGGFPRIQSFLVDILGGLVPGVFFTFSTFLVLAWPLWALVRLIQPGTSDSGTILNQMTAFGQAFRLELVGFSLIVAYIFGHLFFRQAPKEPDARSYHRVVKKFTPEEKEDWVVRGDQEADVQFPYPYLQHYLTARGLDHLAEIVKWDGDDEETRKRRTKGFINLIKVRLQFLFPDQVGQITRNEAHIRLMSSVWYASRALIWVGLLGVGLAGTTMIFLWVRTRDFPSEYFAGVLPAIGAIGLSIWIKWRIEGFLHYQRVREILYVLETAFLAIKLKEGLVLDDIY